MNLFSLLGEQRRDNLEFPEINLLAKWQLQPVSKANTSKTARDANNRDD